MAIYQPFLEAQVSGAGVPQASNSFAGVDAIGRAIEGLADVGKAYLQYEDANKDQLIENEYIRTLEMADQLQTRGQHKEARELARKGLLNFSKAGGDPYHQKFKGLRANLGLSEAYTMDPQEYVESLIVDSDEFKNNFAILYQKAYNEFTNNGTPFDMDTIREEAKGAALNSMATKETIANERNSSAVRLQALKEDLRTSSKGILDTLTGYLDAGHNWFDEGMITHLRTLITTSKRDKYAALGPGATPEMMAEVDRWFADAEEVLKNIETMSSFKGMEETHKKEQFKFLSRLAADPEDSFGITPQDFNWWMMSQDGPDKAASLALMGGENYNQSVERINRALSSMLFVTRGPTKKSNLDYTKFKPFDDEVNPDNMLLKRIDEAIDSPDLTIKEADDIINFLLPGINGDPSSVKDPERAKQVAVSIGMASRLIHRVANEDGWVTPDHMQKIFSTKVDSYMKAIAKENPELYVHLIDYMAANVQTYNAAVEVRRQRLTDEWGVTYTREDGWKVNREFIEANNVWGENSGKKIESISKIAGDFFGVDKDAAFVRLITNESDRASFIDHTRQLERTGTLDKDTLNALELVKFRFSNSANKASTLNAKGMIDGSVYLNKQFGNYASYAQAPIEDVPAADLIRYAPLIEAADIGEGGGDYDMLWNGTQNKAFPWRGTKVSQMTIKQVLDFAGTPSNPTPYRLHVTKESGNNSAPMGRWQFVPETLAWVAEEMGLNFETTIFNEKTQNAMFKWLVDHEVARSTSKIDLLNKIKGRWPGMVATERARKRVVAWIDQTYSFGVEETPDEE